MGKIIQFPKNGMTEFLEIINEEKYFISPGKQQEHKRELTIEEIIIIAQHDLWLLKEYTEYATMQRYRRQFYEGVELLSYKSWIEKMIIDGKVKYETPWHYEERHRHILGKS